MFFTEFRYVVFLLVVLSTYWTLRSNEWRKVLILGASYFFYASWDWRFLSLIVGSTVIDFYLGRWLSLERLPPRRKALVTASLVVNLGVLGFFKYSNFFVDSFSSLASVLGLTVNHALLQVVLPVGVSFYTFQSLSYIIDIYRKEIAPARSLLDFAVAVAFFPHLEAGPIMRARVYLEQLGEARRWSDVDYRWALTLFAVGFIKKACISDNISPYVDAYFSHPAAYGARDAWLSVTLYGAQIYCDFSGYTDMGIASAGLLGYRMCPNFDAPYLAASLTDFWRRWHMSLSSWLRDYLYFPLGGNRRGRGAAHRNLMITMLLGGLWHGASWNFVLWGGLHGLGLIAHKEWVRWRQAAGWGALGSFAGWAATLLFVLVAWIPFRAPTFGSMAEVLGAMTRLRPEGSRSLVSFGAFLGFLAVMLLLLAVQLVKRRGLFNEWWRSGPVWGFAAAYGGLWALLLALKPVGSVPFIYFQF